MKDEVGIIKSKVDCVIPNRLRKTSMHYNLQIKGTCFLYLNSIKKINHRLNAEISDSQVLKIV